MGSGLDTVSVPPPMEELFSAAEAVVSRYFRERRDDPEHGTIEISGERYVLVRAASLSVEFFGLVRELYGAGRLAEADEFARNILFDLAHAIGRKDAKSFHAKMGLTDPLAKLSAGPVHFSHAGWAFVRILPESRPSPDDDFFIVYEHPYSFESHAWLAAGPREGEAFPVCIMNAGYSSGWCQESFGVELVAAEVRCRARGDDACRFVMATPHRIEEHVKREVPLGTTLIPDFFARKRAEERLREAHVELERRVEQRTSELRREMEERRRVERELHQQHKLEALGRLAGGVAHDFNNLMAVVLTNGGLLDRSLSPDDPRRAYSREMIKAVERAAELTRQLLAFGRAGAGDAAPLELDDVVADLARMLDRLIGDDVELSITLGGEGAHVVAARSELEQILVNLVVNARDALPGGGRIGLSTTREGDQVLLRVSDTGVGIAPELLASIFDPFFTTKGAGTGLGLSTVYGIVQRAGGSIRVDSTPGEGSCFTVSLPRVLEVVAPVAPERAPFAEGTGERILLVEDQGSLRSAIAGGLRELGYDVVAAANPEEALAELDRGPPPALLVTDLMLPQTNGAELASLIEARVPGMRVLFVSGFASGALDARRASGKPVAFLPKPFSLEDLGRAVRAALARTDEPPSE